MACVRTGYRDRRHQPLLPGKSLHLPPEPTGHHQRLPSHLTHCHYGARQHGYVDPSYCTQAHTLSSYSMLVRQCRDIVTTYKVLKSSTRVWC